MSSHIICKSFKVTCLIDHDWYRVNQPTINNNKHIPQVLNKKTYRYVGTYAFKPTGSH